jgi:phosphoribosyl 1,2-cyclic phosphate phosphodiesterase
MDDIRPFNYLQQRMMPLYASERVQQALKRDFHYAFDPNKHGGVPQVELVEVRDDDPFEIDGVRWTPLAVMHGQLPIHGYLMDDLAYITDANHLPDGTLEAIKGVDTLVLNALRPAAHYSHFSLAEALEVAKQVGARQTWFTHISHLMGLHMEVNAQLPAGVTLAYDGLELERRNDGWHELAPRLAIRKVRS